MQNAIMAIWHHTQATDDNPDHDLWLLGEHSWCGLPEGQAKGTTDYFLKSEYVPSIKLSYQTILMLRKRLQVFSRYFQFILFFKNVVGHVISR